LFWKWDGNGDGNILVAGVLENIQDSRCRRRRRRRKRRRGYMERRLRPLGVRTYGWLR
jgi:hypothetical protein